jgi:membrane-bound lytic murein transglycosylase B
MPMRSIATTLLHLTLPLTVTLLAGCALPTEGAAVAALPATSAALPVVSAIPRVPVVPVVAVLPDTLATSNTAAATPAAAAATPAPQASAPAPSESASPASAGVAAPTPKPVPAANQPYVQRDDVRAFAESLALSRGLSVDQISQQLATAKYIPAVAKLMMPPAAGTAKDWGAYRSRFIEPKRIAAGAEFWRANDAWLRQAEARWGVPASIIVGVVGVETFYGRITGSFRVIDALATLSFDFPTGRRDRTPFFRAQLEEFLHWCHREGTDPQSVLGSYAGAIGLPQFMPGSITRWALDFDGDGRVDLMKSHADVVGSVAHYMAAHGWQRDMPTHYPVAAPVNASDRATLLVPDILPTFTTAHLQALGAKLDGDAARNHRGPLALVELQNGPSGAPSYVAGTENFYVVTRYNWSSYYALAVIELGQAVQASLEAGRASAKRRAPAANGAGTATAALRPDRKTSAQITR